MLTVALLATAAGPPAAGASADDGAAQAPDYAKLKSSLYELANSSLASVGGAMRKRAERLAGIQKPCDGLYVVIVSTVALVACVCCLCCRVRRYCRSRSYSVGYVKVVPPVAFDEDDVDDAELTALNGDRYAL